MAAGPVAKSKTVYVEVLLPCAAAITEVVVEVQTHPGEEVVVRSEDEVEVKALEVDRLKVGDVAEEVDDLETEVEIAAEEEEAVAQDSFQQPML